MNNLLEELRHRNEKVLDKLLSTHEAPAQLVEAMRYSTLSGGKRLRALLVYSAGLATNAPLSRLDHVAAAVECIHAYSLIHDDLPAMDDDDLRRGLPTVHKKFDEATAILAGDALLTLAFDLITRTVDDIGAEACCELTQLLSRAAGQGGMVGGQILDLAAEGQRLDDIQVRELQSMKTGALIRFACEAGAVLGKANHGDRTALVKYGEAIGAAFQLSDDLLDVISTEEEMGKAVAKDSDKGKGTIVGLVGVERSREILSDLARDADAQLESFGRTAQPLKDITRFVVERKS